MGPVGQKSAPPCARSPARLPPAALPEALAPPASGAAARDSFCCAPSSPVLHALNTTALAGVGTARRLRSTALTARFAARIAEAAGEGVRAAEQESSGRFQLVTAVTAPCLDAAMHVVLFPGADLAADAAGTSTETQRGALALGASIMAELAVRGAAMARDVVNEPDAAMATAAALAALDTAPARHKVPAVLERALAACFEGRPDVSAIETAVQAHVSVVTPTFAGKVEALVFPTGEGPMTVPRPVEVLSARNAERMRSLALSPDAFDAEARALLLADAAWSDSISGNVDGRRVRGAVAEERAYRCAVDFVIERARDTMPLTLYDFVEVNRLVLAGARRNAPRIRKAEAYAGNLHAGIVRQYAEPSAIPGLLATFSHWLENRASDVRGRSLAPEALAAEVHRRLVAIHPFSDGNGRSTRLAAALILLRSNRFPPQLDASEVFLDVFAAHGSATLAGDAYLEAFAAGVARATEIVASRRA